MAEETVWLTQKLIGVLFDKGRSTITEHLKNIFETGELDEKGVFPASLRSVKKLPGRG